MKNYTILFLFLIKISLIFAQETDEKTIEKIIIMRTVEADQNEAQSIVLGRSDFLDSKYPLNIISLGLLNNEELRILRNTIFARYGYKFRSEDLQNHFSSFEWYSAKSNNVDQLLTDVDKWNIDIIHSFEGMNSNQINIINKNEIVGLWHISLIMPSGFAGVFQFYPDGQFRYNYNQMRQLPIIKSFSNWKVANRERLF